MRIHRLHELARAEREWRDAVAAYKTALKGIKPAGEECARKYKAMCDIRERLGMVREPQDEKR